MSTPDPPSGARGRGAATEGVEPLSRNVRVVSLISFLQDTASELLYPVLPFFVTGVLGASPAILGLIEGLADGTASIMKAASGRLADRRRRRPLVASGYGLSAVGKALIALSYAWPGVMVARFVDRVGKGLRGPPRDAIIADETTPANRGRAFGFHRAADTAGAVVGPLIGLAAFEALGHRYRPMFWIAVIPAALSALLVFAIRERPRAELRASSSTIAASSDDEALPRRYWRAITLIGVFGLANFPDTLLLLRAKDLGFGYTGVVGLYVLYNLTYAAGSYPAGLVSDRMSRPRVIAAGLAIFAVSYLGFGLTNTGSWAWVLFPLYGCYTALTDGVMRAWIADLAPPTRRGTALGIQSAVSGVSLMIAGLWAGLAWNGTGHLPFVVSGIAAACIAIAMAAWAPALDRP